MIFYADSGVSIAHSRQETELENKHQGPPNSNTDLTTRLLPQTRKTVPGVNVRRTAVVNVMATYIQNRILRVVTSQGPVVE